MLVAGGSSARMLVLGAIFEAGSGSDGGGGWPELCPRPGDRGASGAEATAPWDSVKSPLAGEINWKSLKTNVLAEVIQVTF
ncbi:unnamed protein product [Caretta caretta]